MPETDGSDLFTRYCLPGNRYKKLLSGSFIRADRKQATEFAASMIDDGREIATNELTELLAGDWREILTACWLIGFGKRCEFQPELHSLVEKGPVRRTGKGVAFALARFCHPSDAYALKRSLERSLPDLTNRESQPWCLGSLLFIEKHVGLDISEDLIAPGGPWDRWSAAGFLESDSPFHWEKEVAAWIDLAERSD
ncbi:hypothetical protein EV284_4506 [Streptomyces sp. BK022]|uniref:DUF6000 family protein n=1 Tax=Streptomyces sp. BK022 TaxID=2512123 RepID=UPI0010291700|nr:DUF6000 family protein [Streptomyces sp. BK022]RZU34904.1 hypothetical protein EV284_4506 [Streptomyces sp. BK022]